MKSPYRFDDRTTAEVEASRSFHNRKPFRTQSQKVEARRTSRKLNGTHVSGANMSHHAPPRGEAS